MSQSPAAGSAGTSRGSWSVWRDRPIVFKVIAAAVAGCIGMVVIAFVSITHLSELRDSARHELAGGGAAGGSG